MKKYPFGKILSTLLILAMAFFAGRGVAELLEQREVRALGQTESAMETAAKNLQKDSAKPEAQQDFEALNSEFTRDENGIYQKVSSLSVLESWPFVLDSPLLPGTENWGLGFGAAGAKPTGNATVDEMKQYNAYYMAEGEEQKIYLTFDCGYENGNTEAILDALKKHNAPATFFVVGHYLESAPDLVQRMVKEGHTVGNHTYHHPDMSKISDLSAFQKEMDSVREKYKEVTGEEMTMYYRPPQGKYNADNLQMAKDLGYSTFFWSLAYVDWNVEKQPTHEEAFSKLTTRIHPGAVVLLHNTSKTNGEILDELLTKWEEMGYTFGKLEELVQN